MADTYNVEDYANVGQLKALALRAKNAVDNAIKKLPVEMFLDTAKTTFVESFTFSAANYPSTTDPNLNGKPVLVLAMNSKSNTDGTVTTSYHFLNMAALIDTYTVKAGDSANILSIAGRQIEVKIDPDTSNALKVTANGLKVAAQDVSGKADIITGGTENNFVAIDGSGNIKDSGKKASDFATPAANPTAGHVATLDASGNPTDSGIAGDDVITKFTGATTGNLIKIKADGKIEDTGIAASKLITTDNLATDAEFKAMLDEVFGAEE